MGVGQENIMYMQDSNHIDMCRFDSREDNDYVTILDSLEEMATGKSPTEGICSYVDS